MNKILMHKPRMTDQIKEGIWNYIQKNNLLELSPLVLWDVAKAVIRGKSIEVINYINKEISKQLKNLHLQFQKAEEYHKLPYRKVILLELVKIRE